MNGKYGFHPYLEDPVQTIVRTRSGGNSTIDLRAPGNCGELPMPENGVLGKCTKDINELFVTCVIECGELYSTTRPRNVGYRYQCKKTGWTRIDKDKENGDYICRGNFHKFQNTNFRN